MGRIKTLSIIREEDEDRIHIDGHAKPTEEVQYLTSSEYINHVAYELARIEYWSPEYKSALMSDDHPFTLLMNQVVLGNVSEVAIALRIEAEKFESIMWSAIATGKIHDPKQRPAQLRALADRWENHFVH
ncbi:MAG: hypothetical protein IT410_03280 [Candidatus Doudnabacteria bacterium]|nr:hypothetical protein [Candidatus Doudnabacteria bacterium]